MAVDIGWHIKNRVMLTDFAGQTTSQDIKDITAALPPMLETGTAPVHWLINIQPDVKPFPDWNVIFDVLSFVRNPKMGHVIIVGQLENGMINATINVVVKVLSARYHRCATMDDADDFLRGLGVTR